MVPYLQEIWGPQVGPFPGRRFARIIMDWSRNGASRRIYLSASYIHLYPTIYLLPFHKSTVSREVGWGGWSFTGLKHFTNLFIDAPSMATWVQCSAEFHSTQSKTLGRSRLHVLHWTLGRFHCACMTAGPGHMCYVLGAGVLCMYIVYL